MIAILPAVVSSSKWPAREIALPECASHREQKHGTSSDVCDWLNDGCWNESSLWQVSQASLGESFNPLVELTHSLARRSCLEVHPDNLPQPRIESVLTSIRSNPEGG